MFLKFKQAYGNSHWVNSVKGSKEEQNIIKEIIYDLSNIKM